MPINLFTGRDIAILHSLEEIKQEQREIKIMLATLMQRQSGPVGSADLPDGVTLPVANVEAMHALEEKLRDHTTMRVMVCTILYFFTLVFVFISSSIVFSPW
ncbi:hypothetical protein DPMN_004885 [Dreissena polymorpha]|uniref:Uncharacterized protein n=1 Tax=Dreissena polymorpha TaxID=45954 RepID=A0A9D4RW27_DREPO|nr:hypothetical protein DPMN_004885 [Dreissena polymorpha]